MPDETKVTEPALAPAPEVAAAAEEPEVSAVETDVAEGATAESAEEPAPEVAASIVEDPEPEAHTGAATEWVEAAPQPEPVMPAQISDETVPAPKSQTEHRVATFLAEAKYFVSQLDQEITGDAGEIIAYLRVRL